MFQAAGMLGITEQPKYEQKSTCRTTEAHCETSSKFVLKFLV